MIVAERKPIEEILKVVNSHGKVLILGCRGCVTVCSAGGEKEVSILGSQLNLACNKEKRRVEFFEKTVERQCDFEYLAGLRHEAKEAEAILSMACGVGVQLCAEYFRNKHVYPALNTKFLGANIALGKWEERCQACGDCVLGQTGGICPVSRCSKSLFNGPCGGSQHGKCEVGKGEIECGWALIIERLTRLRKLDNLKEIMGMKNWRFSRDGGPRKLVREELYLEGRK
ncbi:hypothetical protein Tfer_0120 [Thermincola ferriacetica]|uniref:Methylene-tetrahydrofolate reductase C-terminal-like domain-containing protein n=1 Tax=Thermincola ferriacetica TaxID=281456 RepID=A0A0L6W6F8_9FIRM|nr:methylenetetrahydrofolate reductase C-terminal domain-containing protein [Thermincola ferriacetica]KNZ71046.1 hypothetical protein Tfer_0120 [Thermincola ferriacetica]